LGALLPPLPFAKDSPLPSSSSGEGGLNLSKPSAASVPHPLSPHFRGDERSRYLFQAISSQHIPPPTPLPISRGRWAVQDLFPAIGSQPTTPPPSFLTFQGNGRSRYLFQAIGSQSEVIGCSKDVIALAVPRPLQPANQSLVGPGDCRQTGVQSGDPSQIPELVGPDLHPRLILVSAAQVK
jgi:hypothetical protein